MCLLWESVHKQDHWSGSFYLSWWLLVVHGAANAGYSFSLVGTGLVLPMEGLGFSRAWWEWPILGVHHKRKVDIMFNLDDSGVWQGFHACFLTIVHMQSFAKIVDYYIDHHNCCFHNLPGGVGTSQSVSNWRETDCHFLGGTRVVALLAAWAVLTFSFSFQQASAFECWVISRAQRIYSHLSASSFSSPGAFRWGCGRRGWNGIAEERRRWGVGATFIGEVLVLVSVYRGLCLPFSCSTNEDEVLLSAVTCCQVTTSRGHKAKKIHKHIYLGRIPKTNDHDAECCCSSRPTSMLTHDRNSSIPRGVVPDPWSYYCWILGQWRCLPWWWGIGSWGYVLCLDCLHQASNILSRPWSWRY